MPDVDRVDGSVGDRLCGGYGQLEDLAHTAAAGFAEHLVKPVSLEHLR